VVATTTRCVIYVRISLAGKKKGEKIDRHLGECREYAAAEGWEVCEVFPDDNVSASKYSKKPRPEYERMIHWLAEDIGRKPVVILTTEMERLYRRMEELLTLIRMAESTALAGIHTTGEDHYDLSSANGIHGAIGAVNNAMRESGKLSERQRRRHRARASEGRYLGIRPFGFQKVFDTDDDGNRVPTGMLEVFEPEAAEVRKAMEAVIGGASIWSVHLDWKARGILTPRGHTWRCTDITRMLVAPRNIGVRAHKGVMHDGIWPALVEEETYRAVCDILSAEDRMPANHRTATSTLLAGIARCGKCGHKLAGIGRARKRAYRCPPEGGCLGVHRVMKPVDDLACAAVIHWLREGGPYAEYISAQYKPAHTGPYIEAVKAESRYRIKLDELKRDWLETGMSLAEYQDMRLRLVSKLEEAAAIAKRLRPRPAGSTADGPMTAETWESLSFAQKRLHLAELITAVIVRPTRRGRLTFDPGTVDVIPGAWADGLDAEILDFPRGKAIPTQREAALAYLTEHPGEAVSPAGCARAFGGDVGHMSRTMVGLAEEGLAVQVRKPAGRKPSLYKLAKPAA
jgi:DNA invertase Pin-like site-specific DNA recombinase